jgi:hypothetical protein
LSVVRGIEHTASAWRLTWRLNLAFKPSLIIVNAHGRVTEPSAVDGIINRLAFLETKRFNAFGLEGFPESATE